MKPNLAVAYGMSKRKKMAMGGKVSAPAISEDERDGDMVARIMHKRKQYSEGGMVANDTGEGQSADELPNQFDDLVLRDDLESSSDGANNGDALGDKQEDEDRADIVAKIMRSRSKKDRMPRPA